MPKLGQPRPQGLPRGGARAEAKLERLFISERRDKSITSSKHFLFLSVL